jgi:antibiotic biosynthesis monooxygenase (ABM) superfamily enzyme
MARANNLSNEPVTVVFSWIVTKSEEQTFEHIMHAIHKVARTFPGHMGVTTLQSPTNKNNYQTVLRFDSAEHLDAWMRSSVRQKMMKPLGKIAHADTTVKSRGLETWFEIPGERTVPPPRWKMVAVTFIAIYPISLLFSLFLAPYVENWPVLIRALLLPIIAPIILTYLFMPFLTQRILKRWLYKKDR